jgi:ParB family transcriptional regulator, chromosome partitioning protein
MPFNRPILIPTEAIDPNPDNPRKHFDEAGLNELASNIKEIGQLHPCIVTLSGEDHYQLVAGERRWRAAIRAGLPQVWCVVRPDLSTLDRLRTAISENQMREDFTQADRVSALDALQALVEDAGLRGAGRALGISAGWLSRQLSLRRDPVLFPALEAGQVTFAQADEIRRAPAHLRQTLVDRAIHDGLPSTDIRALVVDARLGERRSRSVQREEIAAKPPLSLEVALDVLLAQRKPSKRDRKVLLQMRELIDRLLSRSEPVTVLPTVVDEDKQKDEQVSDVLEGAPPSRRSLRRAVVRV